MDTIHTLEPAASGRSKCRGCGRTIAKGEMRFGERLPNPFGEGEASYWFHLACAACRRPEPFLSTLPGHESTIDNATVLQQWAEQGLAHPRLPRLAGGQRDPSGRARCRQCRELIEKGGWRLRLQMWEEGRFEPIGYLHPACSTAYFGTPVSQQRLAQTAHDLEAADIAEIVVKMGQT